MDKENLRKEIISRIEAEFPGVVVASLGSGSPDDDFKDNTERFEAYMVPDRVLGRLMDFIRKLSREVAKPCGFSLMVHTLDPDVTTDFRLEEYEAEKAKRIASLPSHSGLSRRQSSRSIKKRPPKPVKKLNNKYSKS